MRKNSYVKRTVASTASMRKKPPVSRRRSSRRPMLVVLFLLIAAAAAVIILTRIAADQKDNDSAGNASSAAGASQAGDAAAQTPVPSATGETTAPPQEDYDDLTPASEMDISSADVETLNTMMIVGNRGYRYFTFDEAYSIRYIELVKAAAEALSGTAQVYSLVAPTATDIMLPQSFLADKDTSDQQKAIDYLYASMGSVAPSVKTVPVFDILKANCDMELYFRTDRNWTSLGAYYAYRAFVRVKGLDALPLTDFTQREFTGFVGGLYAQSAERSALADGEALVAYVPPASVTVTATSSSGESIDGSLFVDVSESASTSKYNAFLGGDYPLMTISNPAITDGSSCLIVKESMGNPFVPYLISHYQTVCVVDYTLYEGNVITLAQERGIQDVLLLNHIEVTSSDYWVPYLEDVFS